MVFIPDKKLFLYLTFGFILFTIIGTLSHELGHYVVATLLGYSAEINYANTFTEKAIPGSNDSFLITLGGVMQTLLTGSLGVLLMIRYKKYFSTELKLKYWLIIFLSLFWLRQLFNLLVIITKILLKKTISMKNDEMNLAGYLHLPELSISIVTALLSIFVFRSVLLAIPLSQRVTLLIALCLGSLVGFMTWMFCLGPLLLP